MESRKIAVLDLGTNTFHLLIVSVSNGKYFEEILRKRDFVNLAEEGIATIGQSAVDRVKKTIKTFANLLQSQGVDHLEVIGTAALRTATNGPEIVDFIQGQLKVPVQVISGDKEANLIFRGTQLVTDLSQTNNLIMDIGGGSIEFILTANNKQEWAKSYPLGISVLYKRFNTSDPISKQEIKEISILLVKDFQDLFDKVRPFQMTALIGASGTFEVLQLIKEKEIFRHKASIVSQKEFSSMYDLITTSSLSERLTMGEIPSQRATLIPLAMVLIKVILDNIDFKEIQVSPYALKEGIISKYLD